GLPTAGLGLQAARLCCGVRSRLHAGLDRRRFADRLRRRKQPGLEAGKLRAGVSRADPAARSLGALDERGDGEGCTADGPAIPDLVSAALRLRSTVSSKPLDCARQLGSDAARVGARL